MHYFGQYIFFYKPRVQRHKKGIEDSSTELECLADSSLCQVLIYILLKKRKKINTKKTGRISTQSVCQPNRVIQKNQNNTGGCLIYGVWTNRQHEIKNQQLLATATSKASLSRQTIQHQRLMRILKHPQVI